MQHKIAARTNMITRYDSIVAKNIRDISMINPPLSDERQRKRVMKLCCCCCCKFLWAICCVCVCGVWWRGGWAAVVGVIFTTERSSYVQSI